MNTRTFWIGVLLIIASALWWLTDCKHARHTVEPEAVATGIKMPALGSRGKGPSYDKSSDTTLTRMLRNVVPEFKTHTFYDFISAQNIDYNLYTPQNLNDSTRVPLVLFMADASTPGRGVNAPLTQGYGGLVWADEEWQKDHPCIVLVPQFSGIAVNDAFKRTPEVDAVLRLVDHIANDYPVDKDRIYTTGQSMGGMISMYYLINYPKVFAAAMLVDCHWNYDKFDKLVRHPFIYVTAGGNSKSQTGAAAVETWAKAEGIVCDSVRFSARLPQRVQDTIVSEMLEHHAPINIITFTAGTSVPEGEKGNEHMHSFDHAYRLEPAREWLFAQSK